MAKPKHTMVPRRGAVLLALLASASNQTLLAALTVGSLNTAMVSSASAATCVTSVSPTFANVVSGVSGAPGITVVSAVTPTFSNAVTGVQTTPGSFLTGASLSTTSTNVVNGVSGQTGTAVTAVAPTFGNALTGVQTTTTQGVIFDRCNSHYSLWKRGNECDGDHYTSRGRQQCHDRQRGRDNSGNGLFFQNGGSDQVIGHQPSGHCERAHRSSAAPRRRRLSSRQ